MHSEKEATKNLKNKIRYRKQRTKGFQTQKLNKNKHNNSLLDNLNKNAVNAKHDSLLQSFRKKTFRKDSFKRAVCEEKFLY